MCNSNLSLAQRQRKGVGDKCTYSISVKCTLSNRYRKWFDTNSVREYIQVSVLVCFISVRQYISVLVSLWPYRSNPNPYRTQISAFHVTISTTFIFPGLLERFGNFSNFLFKSNLMNRKIREIQKECNIIYQFNHFMS